jgi:hypothetical protein
MEQNSYKNTARFYDMDDRQMLKDDLLSPLIVLESSI